MPRTKSRSGSKSTGKAEKRPLRPAELKPVDIEMVNAIRALTRRKTPDGAETCIDPAVAVHLGPKAYQSLLQEAQRRIAELRWTFRVVDYDRLQVRLSYLWKELKDRVNYFVLRGRYGPNAQPIG